MADEQRDQSIERILRRHAAAADVATSQAGCVDAETLAAWAAGSLPSIETTTVETHVAECGRCQAMIAAFVRSEPVELSARPPWWHRWQMRWLVPIATAATVLGLYVANPDRGPDRQGGTLASRDVQVPATQPPEVKEEQKPPPASAPVPPRAPANERQDRVGSSADAAKPERREPDQFARDTAPNPQAAVPAEREAARKERSAAAPAAAAPSVNASTTGSPMSEVVTVTGAAPANAVEPSAVVEIRSPNDAVRWRIVRGGQVERTETAGAQWQLLTMPLGVRLIAGHSPAPTIAWFVGAAGGVYRTADGSFVTRLPFPEAIDLVSVVGVDEREATVTTADGRRFRTVDAGATWVSQ